MKHQLRMSVVIGRALAHPASEQDRYWRDV
jgi:hypothetical protein